MKTYRIAVVPGDGIGHEIVPAAWQVLEAAANKHAFQLEKETFPWGAGYYLNTGKFMPEEGMELLKSFDAIFLAP